MVLGTVCYIGEIIWIKIFQQGVFSSSCLFWLQFLLEAGYFSLFLFSFSDSAAAPFLP